MSLGSTVRFARVYPLLCTGLAILSAIVLLGLGAPHLIDPHRAEVGAVPPREPPSAQYVLGTDTQGREVLAVLVLATPETVKIALIAGIVGLGVGAVLGLIAGYFGGPLDVVVRLATDVLMTIPTLAVMVVVASGLRTMTVELMGLIVASLAWMYPARTIRAQTLSIRERGYVQVAKLNGVEGLELIGRQLIPNLLPFIAASFVATTSQAVLATIGLEALGLGSQNSYTLGMMIYWAQFYGAILRGLWWWWAPPLLLVVAIFVGLLFTSAGMDRLIDRRLQRRA